MRNFGSTSQDFAKQVPVEKTRRPVGFYKQLGLDAATIVSALWFGFSYSMFIKGIVNLPILSIVLVIFITFSGLQVFMPQSMKRRTIVILLQTFFLLVFFISTEGVRIFTIIGPILLLFFFWGELMARREVKNNLRIRYFRTASKQIGKVTTGIAIAVVLLYMPYLDTAEVFIPEGGLNPFFKILTRVTDHFTFQKINLNLNVMEVAKDFAKMKLDGNKEFRELSLQEQEFAIDNASTEIIKQLEKSLKIKIDRSEPVSDLFRTLIINTLEDWRDRLGDVFIFGWLVALFFMAKSISVIIGWLGALFGYLIFQLLQSLNFIHAIGENSMQEVVEY